MKSQKVKWLSDSLPIYEKKLWIQVSNVMICWPEIASSARVLQYWLIRTYKEGLKFKPTFTSAVIRLIYQGLPTYLVSSSSNYYWTWDIGLTRFWDCLLLTLNDLWPPWKTTGITEWYLLTKFEVQATFTSWDIVFTRFWESGAYMKKKILSNGPAHSVTTSEINKSKGTIQFSTLIFKQFSPNNQQSSFTADGMVHLQVV